MACTMGWTAQGTLYHVAHARFVPVHAHRACRTLVVYLQETNLSVAQWLVTYMQQNPITLTGTWEVSPASSLRCTAGLVH